MTNQIGPSAAAARGSLPVDGQVCPPVADVMTAPPMRDPIRSRNHSAAVFLTSLAVFLPALVLSRSGGDLTVRKLILFASLAVLLFSAVWLAVRWDEARRLARLRAGVGIVARWTIDAARLAWFRRLSHEWDQRPDLRPNEADLAQDPGDHGIDVVVSRDAILFGADYWPLEKDVRITVRADWIEFFQVIPKADGQALYTVLRLPLQAGKEALAADVLQAYEHARQASGSGRRQLLYIALICLLGVPAVAAAAWLVAWMTGWIV